MYEKLERYEVNLIPGKGYEVQGQWKDDIHDIRTRIVFDYLTYKVREAEAEVVSAPLTSARKGLRP